MSIDDIQTHLSLMQLSDSFFPTGIYATSNGLECIFSQKKITRCQDILKLIRTSIVQQLAPTDCVAISYVYDNLSQDCYHNIVKADNVLFSSKLIKDIRDASVRSGEQLIKCVLTLVNDEHLNLYSQDKLENDVHAIFPVAFAICCNSLKIDKEKCMAMFLYGFTVGMVGAALRLGIIDHLEGQRIIHKTKPVISGAILESARKSLADIWQFAPQLDIFQMSHGKMDSKMFIT